MKRWKELGAFWRTVPASSTALLLSGIFCLFCSLSFIESSLDNRALTPAEFVLKIVVGGGFPAAWAFILLRRILKAIPVMAVLQAAAQIGWHAGVDPRTHDIPFNSAAFRQKLVIDGAIAIVTLLAGYVLFLMFFEKEGRRFFSTYTEVKLAGDIHRRLVPEVSARTAEFEFFGISAPSGQVGGDLVDLVETDGKWIGYVADVSGHGVPAGALMSMTKSAVRMRVACAGQNADLLSDLNNVLKPLTESNMFVTFAYAAWSGGPDLRFGLAGHLPLLHLRRAQGEVEELFIGNLPLSIEANQRFNTGAVRFECGDILVIVTDGLTEVFDSQNREFGLEPLKRILAKKSGEKLDEISTEMRRSALSHGKQADDQTILLLRRNG